MDFLWKNIFLLVICGLQRASEVYGEPDLDFFMNAKCPSERPYKCPPYATCHDFNHFCRKGEVEPCFPSHILTNNTAKLQLCLQSDNISSLLDATCQCACKSVIADHFLNLASKQGNSSDDARDFYLAFVICLVFMILLIVANIVLLGLLYKTWRRPNITADDIGAPGEENPMLRSNSKNDGNDNREEPEAPPTLDPREADRNINQSSLNDGNLPSTIHIDEVQGRSSNSQNGGSINQQDEQLRGSSSNTQNWGSINQDEQLRGSSSNTQNGDSVNQDEQLQDRSSNIQNGDSVNQDEQRQGRNSNTQNGASMNQDEQRQGRNSNTQNGDSVNQQDGDRSTRNTPDEQTRYESQPRSSIVSPSTVSFRRGVDGTSEECAALIPMTQATESNDDFSRGQDSIDDLSISCSPAMPKAEGNNLDETIKME